MIQQVTFQRMSRRCTASPAFALVPPSACAARPAVGVPSNAQAASTQIRTAVQTALASGKRRLCADLLLSAVDQRARTYDTAAAETVFVALLSSMQTVLTPETGVRVVVAGPTAAVRTSAWASALSSTVDGIDSSQVSVDLLGSSTSADDNRAVLLLNPPTGAARIAETRAELQAAYAANVPIIVHNHPREDAVYESLGYRGVVSRELWTHEMAYLVAPFAIQPEGLERLRNPQSGPRGGGGTIPPEPERFVLMRQFPGKWQLWKYRASDGEAPDEVGLTSVAFTYELCQEYGSSPDDAQLFDAIRESLA